MQTIMGFKISVAADYRLLHCGDLRAFLRPNLRRSFWRESEVRSFAFFSAGFICASRTMRARESPSATASACAWMPPPRTRTLTEYFPVIPSVASGFRAVRRRPSVLKYSSSECSFTSKNCLAPSPMRTRATAVFRRPTPSLYLVAFISSPVISFFCILFFDGEILHHYRTQTIPREHPVHCFPQEFRRPLARSQASERLLLFPARLA